MTLSEDDKRKVDEEFEIWFSSNAPAKWVINSETIHSVKAFVRKAWQASRAALEDKWISVEERLPECSMEPNSFGVQVSVYPPFKDDGYSETHYAFYGCRQTDEPNFYVYGRVFYPTHWMPLPPSPKESV